MAPKQARDKIWLVPLKNHLHCNVEHGRGTEEKLEGPGEWGWRCVLEKYQGIDLKDFKKFFQHGHIYQMLLRGGIDRTYSEWFGLGKNRSLRHLWNSLPSTHLFPLPSALTLSKRTRLLSRFLLGQVSECLTCVHLSTGNTREAAGFSTACCRCFDGSVNAECIP